jgi:thioredoxin 1
LDDLDEIRKKKMEKMMSDMNNPPEPGIQYPDKPVVVNDSTVDSAASQYPLFILDCRRVVRPCRMIAPVW